MYPSLAREQWSRVSADPDLRSDLDYRMIDLDVIHVERSDTVVLLPNEADMLRENAFLVADVETLCDLESWI